MIIICTNASVNIDLQYLMGVFTEVFEFFSTMLDFLHLHHPLVWCWVDENDFKIMVEYILHKSWCLGTKLYLSPSFSSILLPRHHIALPNPPAPQGYSTGHYFPNQIYLSR